MLSWIDVRDTAVVALEMQAARRQHAIQGFERRARRATSRCTRPRLDGEARDFALVFGWTAIATQRCPGKLHPGGCVGRISRTGRGGGYGSKATGTEQRHALLQKQSAVEQPIA